MKHSKLTSLSNYISSLYSLLSIMENGGDITQKFSRESGNIYYVSVFFNIAILPTMFQDEKDADFLVFTRFLYQFKVAVVCKLICLKRAGKFTK